MPTGDPSGLLGTPARNDHSALHSAASFSSLRRRSVLGPPSLFPLQKQEQSTGTGTGTCTDSATPLGSRSRSASKDEDDPDNAGVRISVTQAVEEEHAAVHAEEAMLSAMEISVTKADLDFYYGLVKRQLLRYQSATTGLFPEHSNEKKIGSVHSTVYSCMAVWSLYQAFKRIDDDAGKTYELGQSAVLGLRGILLCWMSQTERLERFKKQQTTENALHCKFHLETGEAVLSVEEHGHLQVNLVAEYLLFLVQGISSGLHIVWSLEEVALVQNLVYYVERAYRTPDFGIWERGSKFNDGTCEVHASSIGMAKAALEAINGFNVYGDLGSTATVIYVDIDAHSRNRVIFETLLPRESSSKGVDAALITAISYPAFATHESTLYKGTKQKIINRLEGKYGFKRFHRDGFGCAEEPAGRRFYPETLLKKFEGVECEWPLFFAYMVIDGVFKRDEKQVERYQERLKKRLAYNEYGDPVLPQYFSVPLNGILDERSNPGSQHRIASNDGCSSPNLFLWGQALLVISELLTTQLLNVYELDPVRRHLPSFIRPRVAGRHSAFEKGGGSGMSSSDLVVQVVTIAESMSLQAMLNTFGIQSQTPTEIEPVRICSQWEMVKVYEHLGRSDRIKLRGRPSRPIGSLGASKVYRVCGQTVLCYPQLFSNSDFYLSHDLALLSDDIKSELKIINQCWRLSKRPTVCLVITEDNLRNPQFPVMLDLLSELRTGVINGVKVRLGRLQNLLASSCIEHLDFVPFDSIAALKLSFFKEFRPRKKIAGYQNLTEVPKKRKINEDKGTFIADFADKSTDDICREILSGGASTHMFGTIQLCGVVLLREGGEFMIGDMSVNQRLETSNRKAGIYRHWSAVRYSSSLLRQMVDSLSPFVTQILVSGKHVTVGTIGIDYSLFDKPMTPGEIHTAIYTKVQPYGVISAVLQQELILYCGKLIATNPELFGGILKLRIGWILHALELYRKMKQDSPEPIENCSPSDIRRLLFSVLYESRALQLSYADTAEGEGVAGFVDKKMQIDSSKPHLSIFQVRQINGCLTRVPEDFYPSVWIILRRTDKGLRIGNEVLAQEPILSQTTATELIFAHRIEALLNTLLEPEYKQLVVELFCVVAELFKRNKELHFSGELVVKTLIDEAIDMFKKDQSIPAGEETGVFYNSSVATTSGYLVRAVINNVLRGSLLSDSSGRSDYNCPVQ